MTLPAVGKNQRGVVAAKLDALIEEQASAERAGLPWYMGHDPELVAQPGPEEDGPDPPVHPATEPARSAEATAVTAMPRRHRKRTVGLTLNIIALTAMWSKGADALFFPRIPREQVPGAVSIGPVVR